MLALFLRHSRESGNLFTYDWIPAFAGMALFLMKTLTYEV